MTRQGNKVFQTGEVFSRFKFLIMLPGDAETICHLLLCFVTRFPGFTETGGKKCAKIHTYPLTQR